MQVIYTYSTLGNNRRPINICTPSIFPLPPPYLDTPRSDQAPSRCIIGSHQKATREGSHDREMGQVGLGAKKGASGEEEEVE